MQAHAPRQAGAQDRRVHHAVAGAFRDDRHMLGLQKTLHRHAALGQRMALAEQAHIALPEQPALEEARLQVGQETDRQVHAPRFHLIAQRIGVVAHRTDRDAGRVPGQPAHQRRQEIDLADVRHRDREGARAGGGLEPGGGVERVVDRPERVGDRLGERLGKRRRDHPFRCADEQFIPQQLAQPVQRIADRRLRDAEGLGDGRNAPLPEQFVEDDQQVEVDVLQFHGVSPRRLALSLRVI